ncbi:alpha/beta fold hydrolase [Gordonia rubripertincta]|uniref:Alpha/beta fold hydrolase n=2 Tax=Gordonia rubripertincta TaxID=36822 RepID=A0AAW6R829_GORRU|nr:alpha/beta fold hydrolase [Gordonia rubripertincta]MDG6780661.1 alpha/beta fold hydrolase [Gordonia rubripertincta]NKY63101.1 alpha/beta fold hydrolase [Gordonia rubripertincta]GAB87607.1 putative epoxide hydrolase [Gordonia rubripertincta NBRC 101908]
MSGRTTDRLTTFRRGRHTFDVVDAGPPDGEPIVLLHGFPQRASSWDLVAPLLHDKGFRTIAPDQRGYSPGARPTRRRDYVQGELVADVLALLDAAGLDDAHVVGHDWGAAVAWTLAAHHPDGVRTLTALSVPHPGAFLQAMPRGQFLRSWYMLAFQIPVLPEKLLGRLMTTRPDFGVRMGLPEPFASRVVPDIAEYGALPGALGWYRAMPVPDKRSVPAQVKVPTSYLWGDRDIALGRVGAQLTSGWVDAPYDFVVLPGADHWLPESRPDDVAAAICRRIHSSVAR